MTTSRGCRDRIASLLALAALMVVALLLVGWLAHALDPDVRREQLARERIRTQQAPAREAALTTLLWGAVAIGLGTAAGLGITLVMDRHARARHLRADATTGLFPQVRGEGGLFVNHNEPGAQSLAALAAAGRRPTAALAGRVIDAQYRQPAPPPPPMPQALEPQARYPVQVDVYSAPLPRDLALPVGVSGDGQQIALPLRNLGNVLVAGLPGGGKSELLASMIAGLLRQDATGQRVQIAAIDTKLVSFGNLPALAALYAPPALEMDDASALTEALLAEVRRRFQQLHAAGARSVEEYQTRTGETLPYVVAVIDELADLTADSDRRRGAAWLAAATEIGRKGRAAGVSLVMATQRPSADVIPSSLRNLAGAGVAFRLARADDSRLVLDAAGAETLPRTPGRCLVRHRDMIQAQAYYAGLVGGRFDQFCAALPAPGWPVRETGIPPFSPVEEPVPANSGGIPGFGTAQTGDYTPEQVAHIRARYDDLRSIKGVQRELYDGQEGGYWFYRIRDAVEAGR